MSIVDSVISHTVESFYNEHKVVAIVEFYDGVGFSFYPHSPIYPVFKEVFAPLIPDYESLDIVRVSFRKNNTGYHLRFICEDTHGTPFMHEIC
jgi:hypothetical protein